MSFLNEPLFRVFNVQGRMGDMGCFFTFYHTNKHFTPEVMVHLCIISVKMGQWRFRGWPPLVTIIVYHGLVSSDSNLCMVWDGI